MSVFASWGLAVVKPGDMGPDANILLGLFGGYGANPYEYIAELKGSIFATSLLGRRVRPEPIYGSC